jgi:hypothetical protein
MGPQAKIFFKLLEQQRQEIEKEAGVGFEWRELPDYKESYIVLRCYGNDITDKNGWEKQHKWFKQTLEIYQKVFSQRIKNLNADDYISDRN